MGILMTIDETVYNILKAIDRKVILLDFRTND